MHDLTSISPEFGKELYNLILDYRLANVLETGTYTGQGSTKCIVEALKVLNESQGLPVELNSIESNLENWLRADALYRDIDWVKLHLGLSVNKDVYPDKDSIGKYVMNMKIKYPHIHIDDVGEDGYWFEVTNCDREDILLELMKKDFKPQLILLDSCGVLGFKEFLRIATTVIRYTHTWFLALDDTEHIKHVETCDLLDTNSFYSARFKLHGAYSSKFGSRIYRIN
jgi:hypothetical protein